MGELSRSLGMTQSRVSNHLRILREHDLLDERHAGTSTYLRLIPGGLGSSAGGKQGADGGRGRRTAVAHPAPPRRAAHARARQPTSSRLRGGHRGAREAEHRVLLRSRRRRVGQDRRSTSRSGQARQRAAASLLPARAGARRPRLRHRLHVARRALSGLAGRLICVDALSGHARRGAPQTRSAPRAGPRSSCARASSTRSRSPTDELDGALAGMVLHHLPQLDGALAEMHRAVRPGGTRRRARARPAPRGIWMHEEPSATATSASTRATWRTRAASSALASRTCWSSRRWTTTCPPSTKGDGPVRPAAQRTQDHEPPESARTPPAPPLPRPRARKSGAPT